MRLTLAAVATLGLLLIGTSSAEAHTDLVSSDPADGARLKQGPTQITMQFNQRIEPRFAVVSVTIGDSPPRRLTARVSGVTVSAAVPDSQWPTATTTPIRGRFAYRVVSADGHPVSGVISFTLTPNPNPSGTASPTAQATSLGPAQTPSPPRAASQATPSDRHVLAVILLSVAGLATAIAVVGLFIHLRRPRRERVNT